MTAERERDTWISLVATPLTGREIVRAKLLGAVWGVRHAAAVAALLGLAGALAGSVHPVGLVLVAAELAAYAAFAAALGTWVSLPVRRHAAGRGRDPGVPAAGERRPDAGHGGPLARAAAGAGRVRAGDARPVAGVARRGAGAAGGEQPGGVTDAMVASLWAGHGAEVWLACLASVAGYATAAWALTRSACRGFDVARPAVGGGPAVRRSGPPCRDDENGPGPSDGRELREGQG